MLTRIKLKNFQGHKDSELDLVPGVNTIIGTSDHGKSSVIRAIRLVNENKPAGDSYVSNWIISNKDRDRSDDCFAEVETAENVLIKRTKGKGKAAKGNEYLIDNDVLTAFGQGVPEEVAEAMNIGELNFQSQSDSFFLINASSAEVMRRVNKYVDLELIDKVLSAAVSDKLETNRNLKRAKADLDGIDVQLKAYDSLDQLEDMVDKVEDTQNEVQATVELKGNIESIISKYGKKQEDIDSMSFISRLERLVKKSEDSFNVLQTFIDKKNKLASIVSRYNAIAADMNDIPKKVERLAEKAQVTYKEMVELDDKLVALEAIVRNYQNYSRAIDDNYIADVNLSKYEEFYSDIEDDKIRAMKIATMISKYDNSKKAIAEAKKTIRISETEFKKIMPEICPLCGSSMEGHTH